jgi:hypothetical protein
MDLSRYLRMVSKCNKGGAFGQQTKRFRSPRVSGRPSVLAVGGYCTILDLVVFLPLDGEIETKQIAVDVSYLESAA